MGKKKSSNKIDPAYYAIGAIVLGIAGYYYYINYYLNGIDLSIGGYILVDASSNVAPTPSIKPKPTPVETEPTPPTPTPDPTPPTPAPDPAPPAPIPGPSPAPITPPEEGHPTMPTVPPFGLPSTVTPGDTPGGDSSPLPPPPPQAVPQLKKCTDFDCDVHEKRVADAKNKNGRIKADCCVSKMCSDVPCAKEYLRVRKPHTIVGHTVEKCCRKMNVSSGWHRIPHIRYDDNTRNLFQKVSSSEECSRKCHSKGNYVFTWNFNNSTCYCKNEMKHPKNSGGQDGDYVSGRFGTGGKMCEHRNMGGRCQTFPVGEYNMHHEKIKGGLGDCATTPAAGRIVALYNDHWRRFVKIDGRRVKMSSTVHSASLPSSWHHERFELVPARNGGFGLYNHKYKNYLRMPGRDKDMDGTNRQKNKHSRIPDDWGWEQFIFENLGNGQYAIKCPYSIGGPSYMRAGGHHVNGVARRGSWEQFRLIDVNCKTGFNDMFSSAIAYPGYVLEMYADENFKGKHWAIASRTANELGSHGDRTSSVKVRWRGH